MLQEGHLVLGQILVVVQVLANHDGIDALWVFFEDSALEDDSEHPVLNVFFDCLFRWARRPHGLT